MTSRLGADTVRTLSDLNGDTLADILRGHFGTKDVVVLDLGEIKLKEGKNDHFMSVIKKTKVRVRIDDGAERELSLLLK